VNNFPLLLSIKAEHPTPECWKYGLEGRVSSFLKAVVLLPKFIIAIFSCSALTKIFAGFTKKLTDFREQVF
jgi:hypothetical protein